MKKKVAIQGIVGSFHEIAAKSYYNEEEITIVPCRTFKDVFKQIDLNSDTIGIIAIENTVVGSILANYTLLKNSATKIIGEFKLRIEHNLAVLPEQTIEDITEVYSHPMALRQCENFFEQYPNIKLIEASDTASSAKEIRTLGIKHRGAICSTLAAKHFDLEILNHGIEDNKQNYTRFLIIENEDVNSVNKQTVNKASIVFSLHHEAGSLSKILTILSFYDINLTKIQSLPAIGHAWEYLFYIDSTFDDYLKYQQAISAIRPLIKNLRILGEYNQFVAKN